MSELDAGDIDVDALLEGVSEPSEGIPMTAEPPTPPPEPEKPQEYEYDWRGQKVKEPIDMILKRASMGRDYNHLVEGLKKDRSAWENERKSWEGKFSRYKEIDEFIGKDPVGKDWWGHVEKAWNDRSQHGKPEIDPNLKPVFEKLGAMEQYIQELRAKEEETKNAGADSKLNEEIQGIRKSYADLPWDVPDANGSTLEKRVLEHGVNGNFPSFKAAFLDLYHEQLEKRWEAKGREAIAKDTQKKSKLGLLGESSTPKKGLTQAANIKAKSYDQLLQEGLEEFGIS